MKKALFVIGIILFLLQGTTQVSFSKNITTCSTIANFAFQQDDEFKPIDDSEISDSDDEFKPINETEEDEFKPIEEDINSDSAESSCSHSCGTHKCTKEKALQDYFHWTLGLLLATIVAGILVRFKFTRSLRGLFLLFSLLFIGFYKTGCIGCPINGFQNFFLGIAGYEVPWQGMTWFIGIIIITYLFGKVWCGWICPLGAVQEFLFLPGRFSFLRGKKTQKIGRILRYIFTIALILQLALMGIKYWCRIDPFINLFDFGNFFNMIIDTETFDTELIIITVLVSLLVISSVLTYRPFCRFVCPVGLLLGFISKIPGASILGITGKCAGCKMCNKACQIDAITRSGKFSELNNQECIMCGDCMDSCPQGGLNTTRKSRKHQNKVICTNECEINN